MRYDKGDFVLFCHREYYLFNCGCHKCQEEVSQADVTSDEDVEGEWEDEEEEDAMQEE